MKKIILVIFIFLIVTTILITSCSDNDFKIRKGNGLHQEVTGAVVVLDYDEVTDKSNNKINKKINNTR